MEISLLMGAILYHHVVEKWFLRILAKIIQTSQKNVFEKEALLRTVKAPKTAAQFCTVT